MLDTQKLKLGSGSQKLGSYHLAWEVVEQTTVPKIISSNPAQSCTFYFHSLSKYLKTFDQLDGDGTVESPNATPSKQAMSVRYYYVLA